MCIAQEADSRGRLIEYHIYLCPYTNISTKTKTCLDIWARIGFGGRVIVFHPMIGFCFAGCTSAVALTTATICVASVRTILVWVSAYVFGERIFSMVAGLLHRSTKFTALYNKTLWSGVQRVPGPTTI
jgi:hypothetical protein